MSQSPDEAADRTNQDQLVQYRNAWSALSQLIGKGRSFSGHERNCCFLNRGDGSFANVSAATGLDLIDDGRAVALADWDFDGAVDLWVANRTAPRVRLLHNQYRSGNHWVAFRLRGTSCNRDAIGARLELYRTGQTRPQLIKTLHAGDGYLAQSSKWIHFGLGDDPKIDHLEVFWPGGARESFGAIVADRHYRLEQSSGQAVEWTRPTPRAALVAEPIKLPPPVPETRTWIMGRVPLPAEKYIAANGQAALLSAYRDRPLLLNLWSRSCLPCLDELSEWAGAGLSSPEDECEVLALCVDAVDGAAAEAGEAQNLIQTMGLPFSVGLPTEDLLNGLEVVQRTFLELQQPLPVPTTFLLDRAGRVAAMYKGRVAAAQLRADLRLLEEPRSAQRDAAVPFPGRWASLLFPFDPLPVTRTLELAGQSDAAVDYLQRYIDLIETRMPKTIVNEEGHQEALIQCYRVLGDQLFRRGDQAGAFKAYASLRRLAPDRGVVHRQIANSLLSAGQPAQALFHFELALKTTPGDATLRYNMGLAELSLNRVAVAIEHFRAAVQSQPRDGAAHFHLANALQLQGESQAAVQHYRTALELQPKSALAANNLAWILATDHNASVRDGTEAVRWAEQGCLATNYEDVSTLTTLACAYAEARQFDKAVETNRRAITLLEKKQDKRSSVIEKLEQRQKLFETGQPFRQP